MEEERGKGGGKKEKDKDRQREAEKEGGVFERKEEDKSNNGAVEGKASLARVGLKPLHVRIKDSRLRINWKSFSLLAANL